MKFLDHLLLKNKAISEKLEEVSTVKAQEKAQEIHLTWLDEFEKSKKREETNEPKSFFFDPFSVVEAMGYKERVMPISYDTLRIMSDRNPVVAAVINTRVNQVASFSRPPRSRYDIGYEFVMRDTDATPTKKDKDRMKELSSMIESTGFVPAVQEEARDDFDTFLRKITRDTLTYDQLTFEIVPGRNRLPASFYAIDAATVRLSTRSKFWRDTSGQQADHSNFPYPYQVMSSPSTFTGDWNTKMDQSGRMSHDADNIKYVQLIYGRVVNVYTEKELCFGVRNPRTNVRQNGYGISELEILINTVTAHLWTEEYNRRFFCSSMISSIYTNKGNLLLKDLIGKEFNIWTGTKWSRAKAFETGIRPKVRTKLWNGLELNTSPEHRFLILKDSDKIMEPEWKEQKELTSGDYALVNNRISDFEMDYDCLNMCKEYAYPIRSQETTIHGKKVKAVPRHECNREYDHWSPSKEMIDDVEFWEMLGFSLGDGYLDTSCLRIFPHHTKDKNISEKFIGICEKYGIEHDKQLVSPSHKRVSDGEYGYPFMKIKDLGMVMWILDLGFRPSSESRRIPNMIFQLPSKIRCAILRGLFSADGHRHKHVTGYCTPTVYSADSTFRQDILRLLFSVGVPSNEVGKGWNRKGTICIQDIAAFVEKIGYLQDYKNENIKRTPKSKSKWDRLHPALGKRLAKEIMKCDNYSNHGNNQWKKSRDSSLDKKDKWLIQKVAAGKSEISRGRIIEIMDKLGMEVSDWLRAYYQVPIDIIDKEPIGHELMGDIEVFDDEHIFLCNGVAVHNSQGSAPKGIIHFEGSAVQQDQLNAFRRQWHAQVAGVYNSWRTPIIASPAKLQYTNLQFNNRQMQFAEWLEYLIKIICSVFLIDPSEINFDISKGMSSSSSSTSSFESRQEQKQKLSRDRGLKPLLKFIEAEINKNLIWQLEPKYEFQFVGLDRQSEGELLELKIKEIQNFKTIDEVRAEFDLPKIGDEKGGDLVLNPSYITYMTQKAMQAQMGGGAPGGEQPGGAPGGEQPGGGGFDFGEEGEMGEKAGAGGEAEAGGGLDFGEEAPEGGGKEG